MTIKFTSSENDFYNVTIASLKEWRIEWLCCPNQRDHDERSKEEKHQKRFRKRHPDHLEVNGVILSRDCTDHVTGKKYKKGTKFKVNGHTRDKCWELGVCEDGQPENVRIRWRYVDSIDAVRAEFAVFDSAEPSEKVNDRIFGAYRNAFSHQGKFIEHPHLYKVGGIAFAYAACQPDEFTRAEKASTGDLLLMVTYLEPALYWLQDVFNDSAFNSNKNKISHTVAMTAAYLESYMKHRGDDVALSRLREFIIRVSNARIDFDETSDACTRFINEWADPDKSTYLYGNTGILCQGSKEMEGFNLLMIDYYIDDNRQGLATKGKEYWRNYYNTWQCNYQDKEEAIEISDFIDETVTL